MSGPFCSVFVGSAVSIGTKIRKIVGTADTDGKNKAKGANGKFLCSKMYEPQIEAVFQKKDRKEQ